MKQTIVLIFLLIGATVFSQHPPPEFFKGLEDMKTNQDLAKQDFLSALKKDSLFHGTYHFLGVIYMDENKLDTAIILFQKSIKLNRTNNRHTREMTYVRLADAYLYKNDFDNAFLTSWDACLQYPENEQINRNLKDICLWSYYTKHNQLNPAYLSPVLKDEYAVNSVPEEYLIMRRIRVNGEYLVFSGQQLVKKKGKYYDFLICSLSKSDKVFEVKFHLNWNPDKETGHQGDTKKVYADSKSPIYERVGARLVEDEKADVKKEIENIMNSK